MHRTVLSFFVLLLMVYTSTCCCPDLQSVLLGAGSVLVQNVPFVWKTQTLVFIASSCTVSLPHTMRQCDPTGFIVWASFAWAFREFINEVTKESSRK